MFLVDKVRATLLWQKYKSVKLEVPESNYQTLCLEVVETNPNRCDRLYAVTGVAVPHLMEIGNTVVYPTDYYQGLNINLVARERMRYVGHNELLKNMIYCSLNPDGKLYFTSSNPQFKYIQSVTITGVFESATEASALECNKECEPFDRVLPLEEPLVSNLIDTIVKMIVGAAYRPADNQNDANDDLASLAQYIRLNTKSNLQKQIEA